ncbi:hypothetical protein ABTL76_19460, partial [Acinetobacter baumannii]
VFSFLEIGEPLHREAFQARVGRLREGKPLSLLDTFLHRDWLRTWARELGFSEPTFTNGDDATHHPAFWQTLVVLRKDEA